MTSSRVRGRARARFVRVPDEVGSVGGSSCMSGDGVGGSALELALMVKMLVVHWDWGVMSEVGCGYRKRQS